MARPTKDRPTIEFPNGEWCHADCDGYTKHGQHYKAYGSCGYVNFRLIDKELIQDIDFIRKKKK